MRKILRTVSTAVRALRRHVMRSLLTCLGIVIGVAAVIAMMELGQGSAQTIRRTISSLGASVVQIDPSDVVRAGASSGAGARNTLTAADAYAISQECSAVRCAAPSVDCRAQIVYGNRNWPSGRVLGTTPDYLVVRNWADLAEGRCFTEAEVAGAACVCLLGKTVARELFAGASPVNQQVRVKDVTMTVIGVLTPKGANMMGSDQDDIVLAPWTTIKFRVSGARSGGAPAAATAAGGQVNSLGQAYPCQQVVLYPSASAAQAADMPQLIRFADMDDIWVSARSQADVPLAIRQVTGLLRERHRLGYDQDDDFRIRDLAEIASTLAASSRLMTNLLLCVALISLVVGGVGIMNIMLASVTERTREIGLRMAVGARSGDILRQFLTEAVILCLLGGAVGIAVGRSASWAVNAFLGWTTMTSLPAMAAAVAVSSAVGIVFGYYPAWKASRLDPIVALGHE
ncbi:MAG: ABC transporter permease [Planctomycetota bacterium]|nr:ABC transporter permease [Planctomycetota bacterium]